MDAQKIRRRMTLEQKAAFCSGLDFWHLHGVENIPPVMVTDGPHGLRKQAEGVDHLGLNESVKAICFPAGCALACSFDPELAERMGAELGKLAQAEDISAVLGPAMNIKRSPLCGRNFEYYSEDPLLSTKMASGAVKGIQSRHVGACPKHFLANNQEYYRMSSNSVVDEQTMREIYLASFEETVREAKPWTVMCSYNKINGTYACENKTYLTDILRGEWGFDGYVMTDWGALDDPVESLKAGLDLGMPGPSPESVRQIVQAVENGTLNEAVVDQAVDRILSVVLKYVENHDDGASYDYEAGHEAARQIETECAVLLKNEDHVLPLSETENVVMIGQYCKAPRYQGGGSSHINPYRVSCAWDEVGKLPHVTYAQGYSDRNGDDDSALLAEAVEKAQLADKAIIFAGLPDAYETEGVDRKSIDMPENQNRLIAAVAAVQPNTVVVLHNGSAISMPWLPSVKAVCGECGTLYRRCVWAKKGKKRIVWRCVSRLDYGTKYCHNSPTLDEEPLQRAILAAINSVMGKQEDMSSQISEAMELELTPIPGQTVSLADVQRRLDELEDRFNNLLEQAAEQMDGQDHMAEFQSITNEIAGLKEQRVRLEAQRKSNAAAAKRMDTASSLLMEASPELTEWNESTIRQLVDTVKVVSSEEIVVYLQGGIEVTQEITG